MYVKYFSTFFTSSSSSLVVHIELKFERWRKKIKRREYKHLVRVDESVAKYVEFLSSNYYICDEIWVKLIFFFEAFMNENETGN